MGHQLPGTQHDKVMKPVCFNPLWLDTLRAQASCPPLRPRHDLLLNGQRIGSVEPARLQQIVTAGQRLRTEAFVMAHGRDASCWQITGDGTQALNHIAQVCRDFNIGCVREQWRNEQLAVFNSVGQHVASVERGLARLLGIPTQAVHLIGYTASGCTWVQQRSPAKAIDPGLWDTLVGGLVPVSDNLTMALVRETWEEAGIELHQVQQLRAGGRVSIRHPNMTDGGAGYVDEQIDWFSGVIPEWLTPCNQDGEVAQFALLEPLELKLQLENNAFTLDASLILSHFLTAH